MSGHTGFHKFYKKIKANYQWDTMKKYIIDFIKKCEWCQKNLKKNRKKNIEPMDITSTSTNAFQKIALDIVGPLPLSEDGNKYSLTLQDDLTKYSQAIHCLNMILKRLQIILFVILYVNLEYQRYY